MKYRQAQNILVDRTLRILLAPAMELASGIEYALSAQCPKRFWKMATIAVWIALGHGLATGLFAVTWPSGLGMLIIAASTGLIWARKA